MHNRNGHRLIQAEGSAEKTEQLTEFPKRMQNNVGETAGTREQRAPQTKPHGKPEGLMTWKSPHCLLKLLFAEAAAAVTTEPQALEGIPGAFLRNHQLRSQSDRPNSGQVQSLAARKTGK